MENLKIPPHNLEVEQATLGAMLINSKCIPRVSKALNPSDFYKEAHEHIATACFELKDKSDIQTVPAWLLKNKKINARDYIIDLVENSSTSAGVDNWCQIIKELSQRRQIIALCHTALENSFHEFEDMGAVLTDLKGGIREIESSNQAEIKSNTELLRDILKDLESDNRTVGVLTGLANIDDKLNGLEPKTTYYIIAESGMAKSALALNIGDYVALHYPGKVPYFTLESTSIALMRRRLAKHSQVALTRIRNRNLRHEGQWDDITKACSVIDESNLMIIDDTHYQTVEDLIAFCESLSMDNKISLIIVDYIQLLESKKKTTSRHLEISYISKLLSFMAKNLNVPVLVISQLGKNVEKRKNQEPMLSDIKESGDIRNQADVIISVFTRTPNETKFFTKIRGLKGKDTGRWTTWLHFDGNYQKFEDCEDQYEPPVKRGGGFNE
jgi:replicative DNA helicase